MASTFNCYSSINIINPDGSTNVGNVGEFDYVDLTYYGGAKFTQLSTYEDIITELSNLGISAKLVAFDIFILDTVVVPQDIPALNNPEINFRYATLITNLDFSQYTRFDMSPYGGDALEFIYTTEDLKSRLETLSGSTVTLGTNSATLDKFEGPALDINMSKDPIVNVIGLPCASEVNDWTDILAVDFTYYGGTVVQTRTDNQVINHFADLGIIAVKDGCGFRLREYTDAPIDLPSCEFDFFNFTGASLFDFDEVDLTPMGGGISVVNNYLDLYPLFDALEYGVFINTADQTGRINSPFCTTITEIVLRKFDTPVATPDILEYCIESGTSFQLNLLDNDTTNGTETITKINNQDVLDGQTITIEVGLDVTLSGGNVIITPTIDYVTTDKQVTYTITNSDGVSSSSYFQFCVADVPVANPDAITIPCNSSMCVDTVIENDYSAIGGLQVVSINNTPVSPGDTVEIATGLTASLTLDGEDICLTTSDSFQGVGMVAYTVSNGSFEASSYVEYTASTCDPCVENSITFPFTPGCAEVCWTSLFFNGVEIDNYLVQLKKSDGSFLLNENGSLFQIAKGTYYDMGVTNPSNSCFPIPSDTYTLYIVNSDEGDDIECASVGFTNNGVPCDGVTCSVDYSGPGGNQSSAMFDVEVGPGSTIVIELFEPYGVPDGLIIEYDGNVIFHTGESAAMPYISNNTTSFTCNGVTYTSQIVDDPMNVEIPITYITGIDSAQVTVKGNPCSSTAWELDIKCIA